MSIIPIFIPHAGCPHQCVFCNQKAISGQKKAALDNARQQIEKWKKWIKGSVNNEAAFYGGSFTGLDSELQKMLLQLTDELLAEKFIGSVRLSTRPDYIYPNNLKFLQKHKVKTIELGVQSLDNNVLLAAERGHTVEDVYQAVKILRNFDFQIGIQLMVGMPKQSFNSLQQTISQVIGLKPDIARIYPLLVIKDTPLEKMYLNGNFVPLSLEQAVIQSAYAYSKLTESGINVIRIGLQPDDELCQEGNIVAGPFHPSMGELVQSYILRMKIAADLKNMSTNSKIVIYTPAKKESKIRGLKNNNLKYWRENFADLNIEIRKHTQNKITVCEVHNEYL